MLPENIYRKRVGGDQKMPFKGKGENVKQKENRGKMKQMENRM
jgi:hypothetical protein